MTATDVKMHAWNIEDREYARHETRRGRRHAFASLSASSTALVVVDMVPFFIADSAYARGIVANINLLATAVRSGGGTVSWIVPEPELYNELAVEFYGPTVAATYDASGGTGPLPERLWAELDYQHGDIILVKTAASAFVPGRCDLHDHLQQRDIDTVIITGTVANVCCEATARDARTLGYRIVMVADAVAAPTDEILNATLRTIYRSFGDVRPTDEVITVVVD